MPQKRDNFSEATKRVIRDRAGNCCSICDKPTSGPLVRRDKQFLDGDACHINSASPDAGPRPDCGLTCEQRRGSENGIWACTRHAREIDRDDSHFTVTELRNYKQRREEKARQEQAYRALRGGVVANDTARLAELSSVTSICDLFDIVRTQPYSYGTTSAARDFLRSSERPAHVLRLASEIVIDAWDTHADGVGILATLLSNNVDLWEPTKSITCALEKVCRRELSRGNWCRVGSIEPTAFALGVKGHAATHRKYLQAAVENDHWRAADADRVEQYYATHGVELAAFERHARDPFRKGLLGANNVSRLMHLLSAPIPDFKRAGVRRGAVNLLRVSARILESCGERAMLKHVLQRLELAEESPEAV